MPDVRSDECATTREARGGAGRGAVGMRLQTMGWARHGELGRGVLGQGRDIGYGEPW